MKHPDRLFDYAFQRFVQAGLEPAVEGTRIRVHIPALGTVMLNFATDEITVSGVVQLNMFRFLQNQVFPHIKLAHYNEEQICRSLTMVLSKHFGGAFSTRSGKGFVVVTWDYVTLSSEDIEPVIERYCMDRRWVTYSLDIDRFYINVAYYRWE